MKNKNAMKRTIIISLFVFSAGLLLTGCERIYGRIDPFRDSETLVYHYTDIPWTMETKASSESTGFREDYSSCFATGPEWMYVDHVIGFALWDDGTEGFAWNAERQAALHKKHGDVKKSPIGALFCYYAGTWNNFYKDIDTLSVVCLEDFDADHPAGSSLLDIIHFGTNSPWRVLNNNYQVDFSDNSLWYNIKNNPYSSFDDEFYDEMIQLGTLADRQIFNTFKRGTELTKDDLMILGDCNIYFDKQPVPFGPRTIRVEFIAEDGTSYPYEVVLTFDRIAK